MSQPLRAALGAYDLLALDLDGTLFGPDGRVSCANVEAVHAARAAGIQVVLCTGRAMVESGTAVAAIDAHLPARGREVAPMVCAGGAMVCDVAGWVQEPRKARPAPGASGAKIAKTAPDCEGAGCGGRTLHRWAMDAGLVSRLCDHFAQAGRAPLILKDRDAADFDYLVVNSGPIEYPTQWWFEVMDVRVKFIDHISHDPHPEHTVRVGFAAGAGAMRPLAQSVHARFGHETFTQHFAAVAGLANAGPHGVKDESVHLLEVFSPQVNKWTAVHRLALSQGVPRERVAAVGDEINDLQLIEGAGLGIAMDNAVPAVKAAATRVTRSNAHDGVAYAIERILAGEW